MVKDCAVTFAIAYNGATLSAVLSSKKKSERILTVSLGNVGFGDIVGFLAGLAEGNSGFRLPSPWKALYNIRFNDLSLQLNLTTRAVGIDCKADLNPGLAGIKTIARSYADTAGIRSVAIVITGRFVDQTCRP